MNSELEEAFFKAQGKEDRESLELQLRYAEIAIAENIKTIKENTVRHSYMDSLIDSLEYWRQQKKEYQEKLYKLCNGDGYLK